MSEAGPIRALSDPARSSGARWWDTIARRHPLLHLAGAAVALVALVPVAWLAHHAWSVRDQPEITQAFWSEDTQEALWNGLELAGVVALLCVGVSIVLAWLTHATDMPGRRFFRVVLNLPLAVPSYVSGFVVVALFGPMGWLQELLAPLGVERLPEVYGFHGAVLALVFVFPYALLPIQAALASTDGRLWEAGRSLGRGPWWVFFVVVLPRLRGAIVSGALLVGLYVLSDFGAVSLLRYESLSYVIYVRYKSLFDKEEAVFLALLLALVAVAIILVARLVARWGRGDERTKGTARPWPTVRLGVWRWPAFALCSVVTAYGVLLPVVAVGVWLLRGASHGDAIGDPIDEAWTTLWLGLVAAVIIVAIAVIPALLARFGGRIASRAVYAATFVGYALPGIVVALALVFFAVREAGAYYQTTELLVFAYVVRFLPLATGALTEAAEAQDVRFYEAARSLGAGPVGAWRRVVLPAMAPAIVAAFLLVFMSVIKELPATLLLSPLDFATLATRIWSLTEEAFFTAAATPVLILLVLAAMALLARPVHR